MPLTKATQNVVEGIVSTGSTGVSAGSFTVGQQYKITSLGTTTQSQWNTIAGTTGQTYVVGFLFTAATTGASSGNGAAAVARTLANRFADVVNVKDFGAVGDGVADDTTAFNAAVSFAGNNKVIIVTNGTYKITNTILNNSVCFLFINSSVTDESYILGNITKFENYGISVGRDFDWRTAQNTNTSLVIGEHISMQQDDPGSLATLRIFPNGNTNVSPTQIAIEPFWINSVNDLNSVGNGEDITSVLCGASSPVVPGGGEERGGWVFKNRTGGNDYRHHQITSFATIGGTVRPIHIVLGSSNMMKFDPQQEVVSFDNSNIVGTVSQGNTVVDIQNSPNTDKLRLFARPNGQHGISNLSGGIEDLEIRFNNYGIGIYDAGGSSPGARVETSHANATLSSEVHTATSASYTGEVIKLSTTKAQNSNFSFLAARANNDLTFNLRGDGNAFADGSWTGGGADYAEFFEWKDGNPNSEDRVGISVVIDDGKIREALSGEIPIGVISSNPTIAADSAWNYWNKKYLTDDFGRKLTEEKEVVSWIETVNEIIENGKIIQDKRIKEHSYFIDEIPENVIVPENLTKEKINVPILNPNFDNSFEYIPRENRKEWSTVGLVGKLKIKKNQQINNNWIKLKDISNNVEEWLIK